MQFSLEWLTANPLVCIITGAAFPICTKTLPRWFSVLLEVTLQFDNSSHKVQEQRTCACALHNFPNMSYTARSYSAAVYSINSAEVVLIYIFSAVFVNTPLTYNMWRYKILWLQMWFCTRIINNLRCVLIGRKCVRNSTMLLANTFQTPWKQLAANVISHMWSWDLCRVCQINNGIYSSFKLPHCEKSPELKSPGHLQLWR